MEFPITTIHLIIALTITLAIWSAVSIGNASNRATGLLAGAGLFGWLAVTAFIAHTNLIFLEETPVYLIGIPLSIPIMVGVLLLRRPSFRNLLVKTPQTMLIAPHMLRVIGAVFLILAELGYLPMTFAIPAGYGDVFTAALVPLILYLSITNSRWAWGAILTWNIIGIADFLGALTTGPAAIPSFLQAIEQPYALNYFVLIPIFAVPIFFITHVYSLYKLFTTKEEVQTMMPAMASYTAVAMKTGVFR